MLPMGEVISQWMNIPEEEAEEEEKRSKLVISCTFHSLELCEHSVTAGLKQRC